MIHIKPKYSSIGNLIATSDGFIVLEHYGPGINEKPYLYKLDLNGNLVWEICHPNPKNAQFNNLEIRDQKIIAFEGSGEAELNPKTGELSNWVMTR